MDLAFWNGKRIFLTGHTGFKGSWLSRILVNAGATVTGYSMAPCTQHNLFSLAGLEERMTSVIGDIRDRDTLEQAFCAAQPEIVLHLAAQPLVRESYRDPVGTYEVNVMGTVYLLDCAHRSKWVRSFLNVTTDKVYDNREWSWGYRETDPLDGYDPYSNSKSCSELVTHSYRRSFLGERMAVSTARAGNVIGGGDFANDRIIPDCVRAIQEKAPILVRNPASIRPYQHVLEPLMAYLMIAQQQYEDSSCAGCYNVGPDDVDCVTTGSLVNMFCNTWGNGLAWENQWREDQPHEANFLKLDCSLIKSTFGWRPRWNIATAIEKTVEWTKVWLSGGDIGGIMDLQIAEYIGEME